MKKTILTLGILIAGVTASFGQHVDSPSGFGFRLWGSDNYKTSLGYNGDGTGANYYYGPVQSWAIKTTMFNGANRGWVWGVKDLGIDPIAALSKDGDMQIAGNFVSMGNIGIGVSSPNHNLHVFGSTRFETGTDRNLDISGWQLAGPNGITMSAGSDVGGVHLPLAFAASNFYFHSGNVGIGTNKTTGYKLSVEGKIRAREIEVNVAVWADYVFAKDYKLLSLDKVEEYIEENNHLPNIPAAADLEENGLDLGAMQVKMMEKIEELTLYVIEQNKKINALEKKVSKTKW